MIVCWPEDQKGCSGYLDCICSPSQDQRPIFSGALWHPWHAQNGREDPVQANWWYGAAGCGLIRVEGSKFVSPIPTATTFAPVGPLGSMIMSTSDNSVRLVTQLYTRNLTQPYTRNLTRLYRRKQLSHTREMNSAIHAKSTQLYTWQDICFGYVVDNHVCLQCVTIWAQYLEYKHVQL